MRAKLSNGLELPVAVVIGLAAEAILVVVLVVVAVFIGSAKLFREVRHAKVSR